MADEPHRHLFGWIAALSGTVTIIGGLYTFLHSPREKPPAPVGQTAGQPAPNLPTSEAPKPSSR